MILTPEQVAGLIVNNGGRGDGVVTGVAIVGRETGGTFDTRAFRPASANPGGGNDRGMWQWNDKAHPEITDADAYDPQRATAWAARKSAGFTDFGPWDIGPNAYSGDDKLPELQASAHWTRARAAAANPDRSALPLGPAAPGGPTTTGEWVDIIAPGATPGERETLLRWGVRENGWRLNEPEDDPANDSAIEHDWADAIVDVAAEYVNRDGTIRSGWLNAAKRAAGMSPTVVMVPGGDLDRMLQWTMSARQNRYGGPSPSLLDQLIGMTEGGPPPGVIGGALTAVDAIAGGVGKLIGILTNPDWWKRIGIAVLGGLLIVAAIALMLSPTNLARKVASQA